MMHIINTCYYLLINESCLRDFWLATVTTGSV